MSDDTCTECGQEFPYDPGTLERFELSCSYGAIKDGQLQAVSLNDWRFCSARCLVHFVNRRFGPDEAAEEPNQT